jgi:hypothetical protein
LSNKFEGQGAEKGEAGGAYRRFSRKKRGEAGVKGVITSIALTEN